MIDLETERKKLELRRVESARMEMEFQIIERQVDIERLQKHIEIQKQKELELRSLLDHKE